MPAPSYHLTNWAGTTDPAGGILTLIEVDLTAAGWTFVEEYAFTQSATSRLMRVWKNPSGLNAAGTDFFVGFVKDAVAGTRLAMRAFEGWDAAGKTIQRPCIQGNASTLPVSQPWSAICFGNSTFVAVASGTSGANATNFAATSPDGITWTHRTLPATAMWSSVTFGNGVFVAVAYGLTTVAATSPDGITWTLRTLPSARDWACVTYANSTFVAIAGGVGTATNVAATSPDGVTWTSRTMPSSSNWQSVTYGNSVFVAITGTVGGTNAAATSPDGITWTARTMPATACWMSVTYGNSVFVAVAGLNSAGTVAATSPDGVTWTLRTLPATAMWQSVVYAASTFVAVAGSAFTVGSGQLSAVAATSADGITWTQRALPSTQPWSCVCYGASVFATVAVSGSIAAASSPDGITWTARMGLGLFTGGVGNWLPTGASTPAMVDTVPSTTLIINTSYDVGVLASKSYLAIGVCANGSTTWIFRWIVGLFNPAYADSQAVYPPLMAVDVGVIPASASSGVSRAVRTIAITNPFAAGVGPESLLLGLASAAGTKEPVSQTIRAVRVAVAGDSIANGFTATSGFRGWLYDAIAVQSVAGTLKVGDTITIGAVVYTVLAQSATSAANFASGVTVNYAFNVTAGT
jgi:hypothetical protein